MSAVARPPIRIRAGRSARRAVLTLHIVASVGLLGDSAGFLAVAIRGASTSDPDLAEASWKTLEPAPASSTPADQLRDDLLSALINLGYQRPVAEKAVEKVLQAQPDARFEAALKDTLRALMKS